MIIIFIDDVNLCWFKVVTFNCVEVVKRMLFCFWCKADLIEIPLNC